MRQIIFIYCVLYPFTIWASGLDSLLNIHASLPDSESKVDLQFEIAQNYISINERDSAIGYAIEAVELSQELEINYSHSLQKLSNFYFRYNQFDKADSVIDLAITHTTDNLHLADLYLDKFGVSLRKGEARGGKKYIDKAREYIGNDTLSLMMRKYQTDMGVYYSYMREPLNALKYLHKAERLTPKDDKRTLSNINHNLSTVYQDIHAYDLALDLGLKNQEIALAEQRHYDALFNYFSLSTTYFAIGEFEQAKATCLKAIELKEKQHISTAFGYIYYVLGLTLVEEGKLDSAIYYFQSGLEISTLQGERKELSDSHRGMCLAMLRKGDLQKALYHGKKSEELATYFDEDLYLYLAEIYSKQKDFEKAFEASQKALNHKLNQQGQQEAYKLISTLLQEKFSQEQEQEQQNFRTTLLKQRTSAILILSGLFLFFLVSILYLQSQSNKKLRKLNQTLEARNHDLNQFTYITSHDLKEPIRNIKSFAVLLERQLRKEGLLQGDNKEYLDYISNGAHTLYKIVESLRVYTDVSNGTVIYETLSLSKIFQTVENNLSSFIGERNGRLSFSNPDQIENIHFSESMLQLILQNLIQNGFKHNDSSSPSVEVFVIKDGQEIKFKITDNGKGIDSQYFEKIFQPFQTLVNKSTTQSSGLGLAICKNIMQKFGKDIQVESDGKNGSSFSFAV